MEISKTVWRGVVEQIKALVPDLHGHQAKALGLWVLGALLAGSLRLSVVAETLVQRGASDAQVLSVQRRLTRWLSNPRVQVALRWQAILPVLLRGWRAQGHLVRLVLDATPLDDRAVVLYLGVWIHGRVLPLAWELLPGQTPWPEAQWSIVARLFAQVQPHLEGMHPTLLADRGLVGHPLVALCEEFGWHSVLRLEGQHCCQPQEGARAGARAGAGAGAGAGAMAAPCPAAADAAGWMRVDQLVRAPGERWFGEVRLWKTTAPIRGHLSVCWDPRAAQPW